MLYIKLYVIQGKHYFVRVTQCTDSPSEQCRCMWGVENSNESLPPFPTSPTPPARLHRRPAMGAHDPPTSPSQWFRGAGSHRPRLPAEGRGFAVAAVPALTCGAAEGRPRPPSPPSPLSPDAAPSPPPLRPRSPGRARRERLRPPATAPPGGAEDRSSPTRRSGAEACSSPGIAKLFSHFFL